MRNQKGVYSVEFAMSFLILLSIVFLAIEVSRFMLSRAIVDLKFREMVMEQRTNTTTPIASLIQQYFSDNALVNEKQIEITARACQNINAYLSSACSQGTGFAQDIVEYHLSYQYNPFIPMFTEEMNKYWRYESYLITRNEPDFEVSQW